MKRFRSILMAIFLLGFVPVRAGSIEEYPHGESRDQLEKDVSGFRVMRNWGIAMLTAGIAVAITGVIVQSNAEDPYDHGGAFFSETREDPGAGQRALGAFITFNGAMIAGGGIAILAVGEIKRSKAAAKLKTLRLKPELGRERRGLALALRF